MALTPKRFWFLNSQVDRLRAEKDQRQLQLLASVGSPEAYTAAQDYLSKQLGDVYVWKKEVPGGVIVLHPDTGEEMDPEYDRAGLLALKAKIAGERS